MNDYHQDRVFSDPFIPEIQRIIGPYLLRPASLDVDRTQATDLVVLHARDVMIAARIRRPGYADSYPFEFTIRAHRESGAKTELEKMVNGWGDLMFYGHAASYDDTAICRWFLIDLHCWRAHLIRNANGQMNLLMGDKSNRDGTWFKWFDLRSFSPGICIASSHPIPVVSGSFNGAEPNQIERAL